MEGEQFQLPFPLSNTKQNPTFLKQPQKFFWARKYLKYKYHLIFVLRLQQTMRNHVVISLIHRKS